jgi:Xaa-Pro aminopeptidase
VTSINISPAEFETRAEKLLEHLRSRHLSGAVLFDNSHILYFTGFGFLMTERPIAFVTNADGEQALFVPRLELEHARSQVGLERVDHYLEYPGPPHPMQVLTGTLADLGITGHIGVDSDGYPWIEGYRGPTLSEVTGQQVRRVADFVEDLMAIKSENEIALIRESARWANLAHRLLQRYTRVGATETEASLRASMEATLTMMSTLGSLYRSLRWYGSGANAVYTGQVGRNSATPHSLASNITFEEGDVLGSVAFAPMWGYDSELERTMFLGRPSNDQRRMFEYMMEARQIALDTIRPGRRCSDVDDAVRAYYGEQGLMPYWRHHTGHAIGLREHEGPFLDMGDHTELRPGMVFTVEPGLYAPELGGFRHSDTIVVTADGAEMITNYPCDLESLTILV